MVKAGAGEMAEVAAQEAMAEAASAAKMAAMGKTDGVGATANMVPPPLRRPMVETEGMGKTASPVKTVRMAATVAAVGWAVMVDGQEAAAWPEEAATEDGGVM